MANGIDPAAIDANTTNQTLNDAFGFICTSALHREDGAAARPFDGVWPLLCREDTNGDKIADVGKHAQLQEAITAGEFARKETHSSACRWSAAVCGGSRHALGNGLEHHSGVEPCGAACGTNVSDHNHCAA